MRLTDDIQPVTYLKTRASKLLDEVNEHRRPMVITQKGRARAVVLDIASYEELRGAIALLKGLAISESDISAKRTTPHAKVIARLRGRHRQGK